jgi:pyruvate ferredoxin oxidoreductase beta subunit
LGWILNFVESNQEALDMILQLYKIAEDRRVSLPTMLNLDGFYLSYSQERVEIPNQNDVDEWLPPYEAPHPVDPTINDSWPSNLIPPVLHTTYRRKYEEVIYDSRKVIEEVGKNFHKNFGRCYGDLVEEYRCEDAESLMVTMGSMTTAARRAIDRLRSEGEKIGLIKLRFMRPFPTDEIRSLAKEVDTIGVVDRVLLHGTGRGGLSTDVKAALYNLESHPSIVNFIAGMGGEDISIDDLYTIGRKVLKTSRSGRIEKEVEFIEHKAPQVPKPLKIDWDEPIYPGSAGCAGCGSSIIIRRMLKVLGPNTVIVIPPCCGTINYPSVSKVPFVLANYAATAAFQTGFFRAYRKKGKADKINLASYSGDGGTVDIGLQAISAAAERGESIIWLCYDNEAYMNTGIQRSSSTPRFASTTSTPIGEVWTGKPQHRKNMVLIMAAHKIPYIATASLAYLPDMERKILKAAKITRAGRGLAYIHVQQPCATGWYFSPEKTVEVGRVAVQTGAWPLIEVENGILKVNVKPRELKPVNEYLKLQRRFHHLTEEQLEKIQEDISTQWQSWLDMEKMGKLPWY